MRRLNLTNQTLESGVHVMSPAGVSIHGKSQWNCVCPCGKDFVALGSELRNNHTRSCGCYSRSGTFVTKHGHRSVTKGSNRQSPMYTLWMNMKARCINDPDYAGRGITFTPKWSDFKTFLHDIETSIGPKPPAVKGYERYWSIDRIENDGNYEIGNVRWANPTEQKLNQRPRRWWKRPT